MRPYRTEGALGSRFVYGETAARMFVYISAMAVMRLSLSSRFGGFPDVLNVANLAHTYPKDTATISCNKRRY